jgi:hypothetical protein
MVILSATQLSARYHGTPTVRTLANWRSMNYGPPYFKVGKTVFYRLIDVEQWESRQTAD